ncbi:MAG TPA: hypothetical protein VIA81_07685 [Acidimicrobiia bacterium]|jgi:hypothetical protein
MEPRGWLIAVAMGIAIGLIPGRNRQHRREVLAALAVTLVIGAVTWVMAPDSIAGPSMVGGTAMALLTAEASRLLIPL